MTAEFLAGRQIVIEALEASSLPALESSDIRYVLSYPDEDLAFAKLDADSLALMEICIFLELRTGIAFSLGDLDAHPTVNSLAEHLRFRLAGG